MHFLPSTFAWGCGQRRRSRSCSKTGSSLGAGRKDKLDAAQIVALGCCLGYIPQLPPRAPHLPSRALGVACPGPGAPQAARLWVCDAPVARVAALRRGAPALPGGTHSVHSTMGRLGVAANAAGIRVIGWHMVLAPRQAARPAACPACARTSVATRVGDVLVALGTARGNPARTVAAGPARPAGC